eukprot:2286294-Prymnesium_polylepis.1
MELSKGWQAWMDVYLAELRCKQLIAGSAARMTQPKMVAAFKLWQHDWDDAMKAASQKGFAELLQEQTDLRRQVEGQLKQVQKDLASALAKIPDGNNPEAERARVLADQLEKEREKR